MGLRPPWYPERMGAENTGRPMLPQTAFFSMLLVPAFSPDTTAATPQFAEAAPAPPATPPREATGIVEQAGSAGHPQEEVPHVAYVNQVKRLVSTAWNQNLDQIPGEIHLTSPRYETAVNAVLGVDGALISVSVVRACGEPALDEAVVEAWRSVAPFPAPATSLVREDGKIYLDNVTFVVQVGKREGP